MWLKSFQKSRWQIKLELLTFIEATEVKLARFLVCVEITSLCFTFQALASISFLSLICLKGNIAFHFERNPKTYKRIPNVH